MSALETPCSSLLVFFPLHRATQARNRLSDESSTVTCLFRTRYATIALMIPIPANTHPGPRLTIISPFRIASMITLASLTHSHTANPQYITTPRSLRLNTIPIKNGEQSKMRKGNLTPKTITAPLAAFTMACILFAYVEEPPVSHEARARVVAVDRSYTDSEQLYPLLDPHGA
ncbi:hypothetical protein LZ30DRAFT_741281 [Colletotrichum cereale]|nr:hypothetical protein LZ30DRAFT_741281 [Colletotrichum cereale]